MNVSPTISACIWSECRPHMVQDVILPALERCPLISEIIIFHAHRQAAFDYSATEKSHIDIVHRYLGDGSGNSEDNAPLYAPWLAWQYARNDIILSVDDDAFCWNTSIGKLYQAYSHNPNIIHTSVGNVLNAKHEIVPEHADEQVVIAHTHTMMLHKRLADCCLANVDKVFLEEASANKDNHIKNDVQNAIRSSGWVAPHNAAIFASLVAFKYSGHLNNAIKVPVLPLHNMSGETVRPLDARTWHAELEKRTMFLKHTMRSLDLDETSTLTSFSAPYKRLGHCRKKVRKSVIKLKSKAYSLLSHYYKDPGFMVLGAARGGTSSLFYYLNQHSRVTPCRTKETMHYAYSFRVGEPLYPLLLQRNHGRRLKRYKSNFPPVMMSESGIITGEASPQYLCAPEAPIRIKKDYPGMRFVISLRDPRQRAWSLYHLFLAENSRRRHAWDREESYDFLTALKKEERHTDEGLPFLLSDLRAYQLHKCLNIEDDNKFPYRGHYSYLSVNYYAYWLKHWFKFFDRSRFLIIQSESLFADPDKVVQRIYKFLGLNAEPLQSIAERNAAPLKYPSMPPEIKQQLTDYFKEPNRELFELLGEEFDW